MRRRSSMLRLPRLPDGCRQPRSRRRTGRPAPPQGSCELFICENDSSTRATNTHQGSDDPIYKQKAERPDNPTVLESVEAPVAKFDSITDIFPLFSGENGFLHDPREHQPHTNDRASAHSNAGPSTNFDKVSFPTLGHKKSWFLPGNVVWAKMACHDWWPAEVMDAKTVLECNSNGYVGHILVQFYGNHQFAWLDPVRDLSQFDCCYESRCKNPLKDFQHALSQQALCRHLGRSPELSAEKSSGELQSSTPHSHSYDTWKNEGVNRIDDECVDGGRGKRKRKMKLHFDELMAPKIRTRKVRKLRIMRSLGLLAPVGSPFSPSRLRTVE